MAATDLVPCFYTGQNFRWEKPAEFRVRAELHRLKKLKLGRFDDHGKIFLFFKAIAAKAKTLWDGPLGRGLLVPFSKPKSYGDKLHYECAMAGDGSWLRGYRPRREIEVSPRSKFSQPGIQWRGYVRQVEVTA
jgi:hypothetical protein